MTRKEEIAHLAIQIASNVDSNLSQDDILAIVYDCVKWADRTMIEKSAKWLLENADSYVTYDDFKIMPSMRADIDVKKLVKNYRKAVEK